MSALLAHAKAARALAEGYAQAALDCGDEGLGLLLARMSQAHGLAAKSLDEQILAECSPPYQTPIKPREQKR